MRRRLSLAAVSAAVLGASLALTATSARAQQQPLPLGSDGMLCRLQTDRLGVMGGLPANLLTAISFVESGRYDKTRQEKTAWPWTVMAEGQGRYFASKQEAVAEVRRLQRRGVRNIDVGCMQINLYYHGDAFPSLEAAFDPAVNVGYAMNFLQNLFKETGSWQAAAVRYHSATPEYANRYRVKIAEEWNALNIANPTGGPSVPQAFAQARVPMGSPAGLNTQIRPYAPSPAQMAAVEQRRQQTEQNRIEMERQRVAAKAFATSWRAEKLAQYMKEKRERNGNDG